MATDSGHPIVCVDPSGRPYGSTPQTLIASSPNAKKLIAFYHRLGIAIELQTDKNGQQAAIGRCPGFAAKFVGGQPASREPAAPLCFLVDDLDVTMQAVAEREGSVVEHVQPFPGGRCAVVADPDGRRMTFLERAPAMVAVPVTDDSVTGAATPLVEPLSPAGRMALRSGAIMVTIGIAIVIAAIGILTAIYFLNATPKKPPQISAMLMLGITFLLAVATVIQIIGKMQMLPAGTKGERIVLMIAVAIESLGVLLRVLSFLEPSLAAFLTLLAGACQIGVILFFYFLRSVTTRLGDATTANLSYALFMLGLGLGAFLALLIGTRGEFIVWMGTAVYTCLLLLLYIVVLVRLTMIPVPMLQPVRATQRQAAHARRK